MRKALIAVMVTNLIGALLNMFGAIFEVACINNCGCGFNWLRTRWCCHLSNFCIKIMKKGLPKPLFYAIIYM